ncbi:MAG TPA: glycosyltransferase [Flavobacteriaceae bacterium]|nr:glycosyltransferase [Flavobacteriaceae bacterium]
MKKVSLEILISTMNRTDLRFLKPMFPNRELSEFNFLIINQTQPDRILETNFPNIRVINSFEYGLSKSRNLALKNSIADVALIADDDVVYSPKFDKIILKAFQKYQAASLITFQMKCPNNQHQKKYIHQERKLTTLLRQPKPSSIEMAFRPDDLRKNDLYFNENFGLGAEFPSGEESLLMLEMLRKNLEIYHIPSIIVEHAGESTGSQKGSEKSIWALSGLKYLEYGNRSKLWLLKFVFSLVQKKIISLSKAIWAYKIGTKAITRSKEIFKNNNPLK